MEFKANHGNTKYLYVVGQANNSNLVNEKEILHYQDYDYLAVIFDNTAADTLEIEEKIMQAKKFIGCLDSLL